MRVYGLTSLGKKIASTREGSDGEVRILQFLRENRSGTGDELEVVGGDRFTMKRLSRQGLTKELTT